MSKKQHLKDSLTLLRDLHSLPIPPNALLFVFDVDSLYPSIPITQGLNALNLAIRGFFDKPKHNFILSLASLILHHHYLTFNDACWHQIKGTAMGSNFVVAYACLFLCHLEDTSGFTNKPHLLYFKDTLMTTLAFG